jgi:hypothetical protein
MMLNPPDHGDVMLPDGQFGFLHWTDSGVLVSSGRRFGAIPDGMTLTIDSVDYETPNGDWDSTTKQFVSTSPDKRTAELVAARNDLQAQIDREAALL